MWRNTGQPVRVLMLDARACVSTLFFVCYWSWPTFYIAAAGMVFFSAISFFGLTLPAVIRLVRRFLAGATRPAVASWQRRRLA